MNVTATAEFNDPSLSFRLQRPTLRKFAQQSLALQASTRVRIALQIVSVLHMLLLPGLLADEAITPSAVSTPEHKHDPQQIEFFEKHVRPLLAKRCYECHDHETGHDNGGLMLDTTAGIAAGGSRGPSINRQDVGNSLLLNAVRYADVDLQMPPEGKLPAAELAVLEQWMQNGAALPEYIQPLPGQTTSGGRTKAIGATAHTQMDRKTARAFWSFQPLRDVAIPAAIPAAAPADWIQQPVDAFVLSQLNQHQLQPAPPADKSTLLRRLTFDLIGLPPSLEELEAFTADTSDRAFETAVERLLASPQYGERWARVWLDLARYTDFTPDWQNPTDRGWMYRDWVVRAFNENLPYDQFLRLQLAADLLPETQPADLAALGFLGLSPTYWKELKLAPAVIEQIVADEWDERVDTVTRTFMGLTVSCARCHDHKFDPISIGDYYALAGVFASTQLHEQPLLPTDHADAVIKARLQLLTLEKKLQAQKDQSSEEAELLQRQIAELRQTTPEVDRPFAHTVREASVFVVPDGPDATQLEFREHQARDLPVFQRGNPLNPGPVMPRRYLNVFLPENSAEVFTHGSGRREMAEAMLTYSGGLIARVIVNRVWAQHFGTGLSATLSDLGFQGDRPTHPELLEYLAFQFVQHGWDIKWLHRQILLSATWQQSAAYREHAFAADPENRLLWRMNRRKLDFEQWRDAILSVTGQLDLTAGGPSKPVDDPANCRRTLYVTVAREELHPVLRMHDFPEASAHSPARIATTTPLQQLFVLNSPWMAAQATAMQQRLSRQSTSGAGRVQICYRLLFSRLPTAQEEEVAREFLGPSYSHSAETVDDARWNSYLQALLGLNEFSFVE